jgi:Tfp pilus assembly protein PilN
MKIKMMLLVLVVFFAGAVVASAQNPHMGTWKLNEAKSKFPKGATKNHTVVYEAAGDQIKVTVDGVDGSGAAIHSEWTGKFDGQPYALTGDPAGDMRSYRTVNRRTLSLRSSKAGKQTTTGTITVAPNGKTRTVKASSKNAQGKWTTSTAVYDRQ